MDERVARTIRAERDSALLFGLFAVAALVMAAVGVYGVAAYAIAQRTKEIGIRIALGAARRDVLRLVVPQTLAPTMIGIADRRRRRIDRHETGRFDGLRRHAAGSGDVRRGRVRAHLGRPCRRVAARAPGDARRIHSSHCEANS